MKRLLLLLSLFTATTLVSCSDDPVTPEDPNKGRRSVVNVFYAHPDESILINAATNDSVFVDSLSYGMHQSGLGQVGEEIRIKFQGLSGSQIGETNPIRVNDSSSAWAIYTGSGTVDEFFAVSQHMPTVTGNFAGVRFINASSNAPALRFRQDIAAGPAITTTSIGFKQSTGDFALVPIAADSIVAINDQNARVQSVDLTLSRLQAGKLYTVIAYGNATSSTVPLVTAIFLEPGQ